MQVVSWIRTEGREMVRCMWLHVAMLAVFGCFVAHAAPQPVVTADLHTSAATFDLDKGRDRITSLDAAWRFHTGDDPAWSAPEFDDSHWNTILADRSWSEQGYKYYGGTAWYRAKIEIPADEGPLRLYLPRVLSSYQIFIDGRLAGTFGGMPPHAWADFTTLPETFTIPVRQSGEAQTVSIAIRIWESPYWSRYYHGGLLGGIRIGSPELIKERSGLDVHQQAWGQVNAILLAVLESLAGLAALALFYLRSREREYLWFGTWLLLSAAIRCLNIYSIFHTMGRKEHDLFWQVLFLLASLASIAFYFRLLHGKRDLLFWAAIVATVANVFLLTGGLTETISVTLWVEVGTVLTLPVSVWIVVLLIRRVYQGLPDARLLMAPVMLQQLVAFFVRTLNLGLLTDWYHIPSDWLYKTSQWPFAFTLTDVADGLFLVAMLAILIHRFTRTRQQEENYSRELESARSVQQLIIPEVAPQTPGFSIAGVYRPFGEVSGDFYQILPIADGGVLLVIGDVSGKGVPAAMTVSLLVGTLRTLAHYTTSPGEILRAMNHRMLARSGGGFTTCLVLRAAMDGTVTAANAGHIPPYMGGVELHTENGLPLGLVAEATYEESTFQVDEKQQVTLVTDGVIEANGKSRELFGFERTRAISHLSAEEIVQAALNFGQDDDITAVTLTRVAVR